MPTMTDNSEESSSQPHQIFVRADELDAGTSILSPSTQLPLSALSSISAPGTARPKPLVRPGIRREGSSVPPPPPPSQPPPAPPAPLGSGDIADSLSLPQLKQLVSQFPKTEQRAYAFHYQESESFETEVDEWFQYTEPEQEREYLLASREAFEHRWKLFCQHHLKSDDASWIEVNHNIRLDFMRSLASDLEGSAMDDRIEALGTVYYVLAGAWSITSGLETDKCSEDFKDIVSPASDHYNAFQLEWMHRGADLVVESSLIGPLYACLFTAAKPGPLSNDANDDSHEGEESTFRDEEYREVSLCFSCFYLFIESARPRLDQLAGKRIRHQLGSLNPSFLLFLASTVSRLRWDESYNLPLIHAIQLLWKSILLIFGDIEHDLEEVKKTLHPRVDPFSAEAPHPVLTASPLDYHLFRQEITSKYPAYNPPLPLIPLEVEQKTILPLMPQHSRPSAPGPGTMSNHASSILHQPVHIATPAPSPPPSPVGPGGKAGKKQNYQTNQNFPFLYPPLDSSSNEIGGKGSSELQDLMVGKKWEGSDVPTSIIEAGELFASRMRMTRAMSQLWKQRDLFMKYDRGWGGDEQKQKPIDTSTVPTSDDDDLEALKDSDLRSRLSAVEHFFHHALPDMQSLVIVLMKVMLSNVQDIAIRNGNFSDLANPPGSGLNRTKSNSNVTSQTMPMPPPPTKPADMTIEDLDNVRSREISQKAISGALLLLLKWFKISHILKFEYLTQLLLDSNYVQLTLKYFAHQNLEDLVAFKYDRDDLSFFHYCHLHSDHPPLLPTSPKSHSSNSSLDDAMPPPIPRHRRSSGTTSSNPPANATTNNPADPQDGPQSHPQPQSIPALDELGNPLSPTTFPLSPITTFSFRHLFTSTTLLRILQKLTSRKPHRILLLVQFKSSQILRRILRVPEPTLRLYTLKLFKSQVPYCGRKWRQSNMRVITAVYLHCRPELRDEWLSTSGSGGGFGMGMGMVGGGMHDIQQSSDGDVEESLSVEWGWRGLTYWWLKRRYPDEMRLRDQKALRHGGGGGGGSRSTDANPNTDADGNVDGERDGDGDANANEYEEARIQEIEDDERDFFQRELDQLGWGLAVFGVGDDVAFGEEAPGITNGASGGIGGGNGGGGNGGGGGNASVGEFGVGVGINGGGDGSRDWETPNAATLEAWQNE